MKEIRDILDNDQSAEAFRDVHALWGNPFSMSVPALMMCWHAVLRGGGPVLDAGTGLSTIVLALAAERVGAHVHAVDTDAEWMRKTREAAHAAGLENITFHVLQRVADEPIRLFRYHTPEAFAVASIDATIDIDARLTIFDALRDKLGGAYVVFDDVHKKATSDAMKSFAAETSHKLAFVKGYPNFAVLTPQASH